LKEKIKIGAIAIWEKAVTFRGEVFARLRYGLRASGIGVLNGKLLFAGKLGASA